MLLFKDLFPSITKYAFKSTTWFLWSVGSKQFIYKIFYPKNIFRIIFILKLCLHMFLQKQPILQKQINKQMAWFGRIIFANSNDIKFANFGRVDQKLWNLQIQTSNRQVSVFKRNY